MQPAARFAADRYKAIALTDDSVHGRKAEPGAFANSLGSEERLKKACLHFRCDARAIVRNGQHHVETGFCLRTQRRDIFKLNVGRFDTEFTASRHGVPRIDGKIHDDVADLARIDFHGLQRTAMHDHQIDVLAEELPQQMFTVEHHLAQVEDLGRQHRTPRKREQLTGEFRGAFPRLPDSLDHFPGRFIHLAV